ncbi:metallo-beta-lactamase family [Trichoderma arundinaceum]|uniref:Metallo-beta-lactamase family n=1 Tax=Trichoderma arundinaceum TaxID=490622 RepID=A0A395NNV6_TRIAR|nr:metallo-beta-lactamase family [Trichoderma arundinaceum]
MLSPNIFTVALAGIVAIARAKNVAYAPSCALRVESHINAGLSFNMVSSLIIGKQAAVLIDMPLAIPEAKSLADWVKKVTDKPLIAVFTTHFHPDHYLSGGAFLAEFPSAKYYANSKAIASMKLEAANQVAVWQAAYGEAQVVANTSLPEAYDFTFFTLPGDEDTPIELLSPLTGDTVDETLFWIPSIKTLIAGDSIYSHELHMWLADLQTPELTTSWLSTLGFIEQLKPATTIAGHSLTVEGITSTQNLNFARAYVTFWQKNIESKGPNFYTPEEIFNKFNQAFPGRVQNSVSNLLLNFTSEQHGRGGTRANRGVNLTAYDDIKVLNGWLF